jgi:hypothetical protein
MEIMKITIYLSLIIACLMFQMAWAVPDKDGQIIVEGNNKYLVGALSGGKTKKLEVADELETKFGVLRTVFDRVSYGLAFFMFLDGKLIQEGPQHIYGVYYIGQQPWVLVGSNQGGMNPNNLSFFRINKDKSASEVKYKEPWVFVSYDQELNVKTEGNQLVVDLGFDDQKQKLAILENDTIIIEYKEVKLNAVTADDCQELYRIAKGECTWGHTRSDCQNRAIGMTPSSVVNLTNFKYVSGKPGFDKDGFDGECLKACKSGVISQYEAFAKSACGYGK